MSVKKSVPLKLKKKANSKKKVKKSIRRQSKKPKKKEDNYTIGQIYVDHHTLQGQRDYQEDRLFVNQNDKHIIFGVFDGHGGDTCSEFCVTTFPKLVSDMILKTKFSHAKVLEHAITKTIKQWDKFSIGCSITEDEKKTKFFETVDDTEFEISGKSSGTTAVCGIYDKRTRKMNIVNLGDSRAVWRLSDSPVIWSTVDHAVPKQPRNVNETIPVTNVDGRLNGDLAMSRSIGDNTRELLGAINRSPDIYTIKLKKKQTGLFVIGSDGLFDELSTQKIFLEDRQTAKDYIRDAGGDAAEDNVSVIVIKI